MIFDTLAKVVFVDDDDDDDEDANDAGTGKSLAEFWIDEAQLGWRERLALAFAGWRDGRRGLVEVADGVAHSAYLEMQRSKATSEAIQLAQTVRIRIAATLEDIACLEMNIPEGEAYLATLKERKRLKQEVAEQEAAKQEENAETGADKPVAPCGVFSAQSDERELQLVRRSLRNDRERLISQRLELGFLKDGAWILLDMLVERYRERAARYLRSVDASSRRLCCAQVQPPSIREDVERIIRNALAGIEGCGGQTQDPDAADCDAADAEAGADPSVRSDAGADEGANRKPETGAGNLDAARTGNATI